MKQGLIHEYRIWRSSQISKKVVRPTSRALWSKLKERKSPLAVD